MQRHTWGLITKYKKSDQKSETIKIKTKENAVPPRVSRKVKYCLSSVFIPEKGLFILESEPLKRCITVDRSNLVLDDCERPTRNMLWKWVSQHRLFNLGTGTCLGLNLSNKTQPLGTFRCDCALSVLWWRCNGKVLQGASQWKVAVTGRLVVVKRNVHHFWKRYSTDREGPCSQPYEGKLPHVGSEI